VCGAIAMVRVDDIVARRFECYHLAGEARTSLSGYKCPGGGVGVDGGNNSVAIVMKWVWAWRGRVLGAMRRERRENFLPF
jgi:hypothetical protein